MMGSVGTITVDVRDGECAGSHMAPRVDRNRRSKEPQKSWISLDTRSGITGIRRGHWSSIARVSPTYQPQSALYRPLQGSWHDRLAT